MPEGGTNQQEAPKYSIKNLYESLKNLMIYGSNPLIRVVDLWTGMTRLEKPLKKNLLFPCFQLALQVPKLWISLGIILRHLPTFLKMKPISVIIVIHLKVTWITTTCISADRCCPIYIS